MPQLLLIFVTILAAIMAVVLIKNFYMAKELWSFMKVRKKWWLLPLIALLLLVSALIIFAASTPLSPFIYAFI